MSAPETLAEARRADRVAARSRRLAALVDERRQTDLAIAKTVADLRRDSLSWGRIAQLLGVSKQAAQSRFSSR